MSKKGMEPFLFLFLCGKLYGWIHRVYVLQELFFLILLQNDKCVIYKPFPPSGGSLQLIGLCPQNTPYINCPAQGSQEIPWLPAGFAHRIGLRTRNKYCASKVIASPGCFEWTQWFFGWRSLSCSNFFLITSIAGFTGIDVKRAATSCDMMHSPSSSWIFLMSYANSLGLFTWCIVFPARGFKILASSLATP